ncbi:MAG: 30S ribosomal protein S6 [Candidatus Omnitrophica bacterium]|nr:30S ribosomal protein S6 [Candidatus Omnitrophota bacterium]
METNDVYEGLFVLDGELSEEALAKTQRQITEQIVTLGGAVERQEPWGKRRLAYRVRKRRDGFYWLVVCRLPAAAVGALVSWCAMQESILRRLLVRAPAVDPQPVGATTTNGQSQ